MKKIALLFVLLLTATPFFAQDPPKREFRAAFVATILNIDWPSSKYLTQEAQRQEFRDLLDRHKQSGLNAIFVQIRGYCDAIYPSPIEPWTDVIGAVPQYDPLEFMVSECHKRGMEFHAWFNPYRAVANGNNISALDPNHVARKRPEWLLAYGNLRILDPGLPAVRNYVASVVVDVVKRYDIDGVHFDDYFYPYPATGLVLNDDATFAANSRGFTDRANWRRDNVDLFVKMISDTIHATKAWVKFGISPFGIWQNRNTAQPLGSATAGLESYNAQYADSRKWLTSGWLDYAAPQIYFYIGQTVANYSLLVPWWSSIATGKHIYVSQAAYRINENANWPATQLPTQIRLNRETPNVFGSIYFSSSSLKSNPLGFTDSLRTSLYAYPALMPRMKWIDSIPPILPVNVIAIRNPTFVRLTWTKPQATTQEFDKVRQFVIYRFDDNAPIDITNVKAIRYITPTDTTAFVDDQVQGNRKYTYVVTSLDRMHNESVASAPSVILNAVSRNLIDESLVLLASPNPFSESIQIRYEIPNNRSVVLTINDLRGREVARLVQQPQTTGSYTMSFEPRDLPNGVYLISLKTEDGYQVRKVVLNR